MAVGAERLAYFKKIVALPDTRMTDFELNFRGLSKGSTWAALASFLYLDFLDTTGG